MRIEGGVLQTRYSTDPSAGEDEQDLWLKVASGIALAPELHSTPGVLVDEAVASGRDDASWKNGEKAPSVAS